MVFSVPHCKKILNISTGESPKFFLQNLVERNVSMQFPRRLNVTFLMLYLSEHLVKQKKKLDINHKR